jgi:flagellar capping protein FliD
VNAQFEKQLDFITGTEFQEGEVYWVEDQLNTTIDNLDEQISDMEARLVQKEQILRKQFTQLETMMSQFRSQSSYLQSVLG